MKLHELFPEISLNPASAKDIKQWILQLAVEGKLTKKWREESKLKFNKNLLNEIIDFNNKEYKVKKSKDNILVKESLFPNSWNAVRTKEILSLRKGKNPKDLSEQVKKFPYLDIEALDRKNIRRWSDDEKAPMCTENDILVVCDGSRSGLILQGENGILGSTLAIIQTYPKIQSYIKILFQALFKELNTSMKGAAIPHLDTKALTEITIGLPPLEEQQAIVTIVEDLFKEVDALAQKATERITLKRSYAESALQRLCDVDTKSEWRQLVSVFPEIFNDKQTIKTLRETILQLAVEGKLTAKWRSKEGVHQTAHELLAQIKAEKIQLIKEKKIKAEKPLPAIEADEIPFELPEGWVWCRLGDVSKQITDGEHLTPPRLSEGRLLLSAKNVRDGYIDYENCDYISEENFQKSIKRCHPEVGDLLIVSVGGTIGRISMVNENIPFALVRSVAMIKNSRIVPDYLRWVMNSPLLQESVESRKRGGAQPCLYLSEIKEFKFPLAPIHEQQIIVEKVNALMGLCDELEKGVENKQDLLNAMN